MEGTHASELQREYLAQATPLNIETAHPHIADWKRIRACYTDQLRQGSGELPSSVVVLEEKLAATRCLVVRPRAGSASGQPPILYFFGGGYVLPGPDLALRTPIALSIALGCEVLVPDYRLAPEHPFPAAFEDGVAACAALAERHHDEAYLVAGHSSGAHLAVTVVQHVLSEGLGAPERLALTSPWIFTKERAGSSHRILESADPTLSWIGFVQHASDACFGAADVLDPRVSPLCTSFNAQYPDTLIMTGTRDLFQSDAACLQHALRQSGIRAELILIESVGHELGVDDSAEERYRLDELVKFFSSPKPLAPANDPTSAS